MTPRPLTVAIATLSALTALTACNGSPEAGHPNTTPTSPTATPTPTAPSTPEWTPEETAAITAAKARYVAARAAVEKALADPEALNRSGLEKAGNGGEWIIAVIGDARFQERNGWYQSGRAKIFTKKVVSVKLEIEQPEVLLSNCVDSSGVVTRFTRDDKPVPMGPGNGNRHLFSSRLVYAPPAPGGEKMWFLVSEKAAGKC
ncbi:hypothetical protein [Kribbella sp. CA-247076]|uniref:hypothetical protein n=1 Tax=Kribbella sp. CA-247076 TaxID=3239941 RepID=UPI003D8CE555